MRCSVAVSVIIGRARTLGDTMSTKHDNTSSTIVCSKHSNRILKDSF